MHNKDVLGVHLTSLIKWIFIAILVLLLQSNSLAVARNLQKIDASSDYQQIWAEGTFCVAIVDRRTYLSCFDSYSGSWF